jgi:hypothetical protein
LQITTRQKNGAGDFQLDSPIGSFQGTDGKKEGRKAVYRVEEGWKGGRKGRAEGKGGQGTDGRMGGKEGWMEMKDGKKESDIRVEEGWKGGRKGRTGGKKEGEEGKGK